MDCYDFQDVPTPETVGSDYTGLIQFRSPLHGLGSTMFGLRKSSYEWPFYAYLLFNCTEEQML
jgi:hypothetical protein